jgi:nucleoside-diphosphate-sugar epimerase
MRVLVAGATGAIGKPLVRALVAAWFRNEIVGMAAPRLPKSGSMSVVSFHISE